MDAQGWAIVIGAVFLGLTQMLSMWLDYKREERNIKKLAKVTAKVEEVHKATNSLTDRLVESTRMEAHAAGLKQGQSEKREP